MIIVILSFASRDNACSLLYFNPCCVATIQGVRNSLYTIMILRRILEYQYNLIKSIKIFSPNTISNILYQNPLFYSEMHEKVNENGKIR